MLPRLLTLILLFTFTAHVAAQESPRSSAYGPPPRRTVQPAAYVEDNAAPQTEWTTGETDDKEPSRSTPIRLTPRNKSNSKELARPSASSTTSAITTVLGSLGIVLGLFVALVWFSRRFAPAGTAALPKEAVELLGRTALERDASNAARASRCQTAASGTVAARDADPDRNHFRCRGRTPQRALSPPETRECHGDISQPGGPDRQRTDHEFVCRFQSPNPSSRNGNVPNSCHGEGVTP